LHIFRKGSEIFICDDPIREETEAKKKDKLISATIPDQETACCHYI
jgi:hypothetical protein